MKKVFFVLIVIVFLIELKASVTVEYKTRLASEIIKTEFVEGIEYFNVYELNKAFKAQIVEGVLDQRLNINIYDEQLIFLLESSYLSFHSELYNYTFPIIQKDEKYLIPVKFLEEILPLIIPDKISYTNNKIVATTPIDNSIRTIVLDPGHGGKDPGAVSFSKDNFEKDIVLIITRKLEKMLSDSLGVKILLTRDKDEFVSLQQRTQFANGNNANLFISIHCNAHYNKKIDGIEVYYLSTAKTDDARAVEALENKVVYEFEGGEEAVKKYDDLAFILADMAQSEHLEESYDLGMKLQNALVNSTNSYNRGVKQANFYVLRGAFMPAVLVELGFLSNKEEEKKLINSKYQDKLVRSMFEGIRDFKFKYDKMQ
ncbi:MAG: N-acetylmuramoyl-L-alanine amidase [Candidatus Cloacimonetes bacterium]|nr:N-acetylmuramoyl-L-alanine amidase [Candidatus Cloacimonadota bacterium]